MRKFMNAIRSKTTKFLTIFFLVLLQLETIGWAQAQKPTALAELAAYTGLDREQRLIAGAKAEGKVVWYTSLAGSSYKELAKGFEAKYPGVKVAVYRAESNELRAKITAEANPRQYTVDTIETTCPMLDTLRKDGLLAVNPSP